MPQLGRSHCLYAKTRPGELIKPKRGFQKPYTRPHPPISDATPLRSRSEKAPLLFEAPSVENYLWNWGSIPVLNRFKIDFLKIDVG
jgi:hypothetical protein